MLVNDILSASREAYKSSFYSQTISIRDLNYPESLISSVEISDDCVSKFAFLVRVRD